MKRIACFKAMLLAMVLVFGACAEKPKIAESPHGLMGVAGFTQPRFNWELMAGYIPEPGHVVDKKILNKLTEILVATLKAHEVEGFLPPVRVMQCQEIVVFESIGQGRQAALRYWLDVGGCEGVDYLLVPQVLYYRNRPGGEWGSSSGASVNMDLFLLDIRKGSVAGRFHFDETQQPLASNVLEAEKFLKRGGKWITGEQLAKEGIEQGLTELGL